MTGLDLSLPSGADPSNLPPQQPLDLSFSPPSPDPLTEHPAYQAEMQRLKDTEQARNETFLANYRLALGSNPTMVGEAQQIASKLGQPPDAVENNLDVAREVYRQRSLRDRELMRTHPILMQSLQNRHFLRLAHDDLDNLAATDTVFAMMGRKWESGQAMNERGYIGSRMAAGIGTQADKDRLAELNAITENASRDSGFVASTTEVLGQMAGTIPTALAIGGAAALPASLGGPLTAGTAFAWGFGATVFAQSAMIEGGNQYIDLIDMGVDPDKAAVMALGVGLINGALELVGTKVVAKPFQLAAKEITHRVIGGLSKETAGKAFGEFVKEYAKSVGGEVTTEVLQEITNVVTESIARPEGQPEPTWGEIRSRLGEIALKTAQGMSVLALPGPVLHYASQSQRAAEATQRAEAFQRQVELSAESKVRAANPQGHEDYVSKVAEATKNADLYVDAPAFAQAMQAAGVTRADLQQKEPELFRQLEKAEEHPDLQMDVVLKNAAFQSRLAKTPLGDALMEHVRHSQDGMSMAEAQQWISEQQKLAKEAGSLVQEKQATDKAFVESAKRVEDATYEQVKATGRIVDAKEARTAAQFYRDFVIVQAARRGLTPEQFHAQYPLQVKRDDGQTGARFDQLRTDTPEFKAWFGDSKVVDEAGRPLVVYHGTNIAFDVFDVDRVGSSTDRGKLGVGFYFTEDPRLASSYATLARAKRGMTGEQVYPVHLSLRNPLVLSTESGDVWSQLRAVSEKLGVSDDPVTDHASNAPNPEWSVAFTAALKANGYDGVTLDFGDGRREHVVFNNTQIKSVNNDGTYGLHDPNILRAGEKASPRGGFIPDSLTILLHEKADSSTFFHESAHAFLTIYADLAAKGDALAAADMQTLLDWFGVKDIATWNAMSLEQQRKHHEKFAYSFEGYLFDGKAPSLEMQGLFDRFKVWLRRVYKTIRDIGATYEKEFGEPLPILTGEVRSVMDRMLASEDAIAEAEAVRGMAAIYQTQEQSGMDDAAWAAYQDEARKAREAGVASLEKDSLRQMQWLDGARNKRLKAMQAEHKEVRDKVRREVVAEVAARPETRADRWLRTGRLLNDDGTTAQGDKDTNHKLDRATVEAMGLGPAETARLEPYLRSDGLPPDAVAEQFGYDCGEGMLRALAAMKPFGEAVDARTTERMLAEHSDLADPAEVEAAVERALHNEVRASFVAIELRHLAKSTQPVRLMLAAAKEAARTAIANLPFREASAKKFAQNEARAARQVTEALRKGDSALAADWQQKRLLQHALATVAGEFQEQAAKDLRNLSRFRRPDAKMAKTRDTDLVNAARWILSRFNLGTPSQEATATRALTAIAKYDAAMSRQLAPLIQDADQNGRDYRDLTVEQFRDLMAKVDGLWNDSKRSQQIRIDGKLMERAVAREAIVAQLVKSGLSAAGKDQPIRRAVGSVAASLRHPESWALEMDGGQPGPVHKYLFQLLRDPVNDFLLERTQMRNELDVAIRKLPTLYGRKFEAKELIDQKTGKPHVFQNRHELVGFLLHAGNEDNMRIDAVGRGWVTLDADGNANLAPVWRFIERMVNEGHLTKADFDFAQGNVWDVFESRLKARAQEAHKDNYGYYFNEIEAKPITVRFPNGETATYRGGYMPAKADIDEDTRVGMVSVDGVTESGGEFLDRHPSAPKGFTVTRTGSNRALSHDLRLASQAFSEELQFIHLQRPGRDLASILNDKEVSAAIQGVDQRALQDMFFPWLQDTMRNRLMAPGGNPMVNKALIALRRNVGLAYMFGNISNGIQQLTGFATSLTYVPLKHLRAGMKLAMRASEREQMLADSKFMLLRLDKRMGQITDDIDLILNPTWLGNVQKWTQRHGYFLQQWFQAPVDVVTWLGAKDHAIAQGKTNAEAIVWADAAVRRSQGSGTAADISRLERSSAVVRLLTQFGGFWLASLNTILQRHGPEQAKATATIIAFAGVTAGALSQALKGGWDDDDEDGALWDDIAGWAVGEAAKTGASLVPVVGSMAYSLVTGDRGGRLSPAATLGAAEQGSRGLRALAAIAAGKRDAKGQDIKDVSLFLSVILGAAPASLAARPISYQFDVSRGNVQPTGPVDYVRGLATGTPAPGTKK